MSQTIHEDISVLRQLAESGRKGPILGGIFLAAAGIIFGGTCFLDFAASQGVFPLRGLPLWLGASVLFALIWFLLFFRMRSSPKTVSATNATFGTIWSAMAIGVMTAFFTTLLIARQTGDDTVLSAYVPVIYAFYGTAWFASGALARRRWMFFAGIGSFLFAFVIAILSRSDYQSAAMGAGLLVLLAVPGFKMVMDEARP